MSTTNRILTLLGVSLHVLVALLLGVDNRTAAVQRAQERKII